MKKIFLVFSILFGLLLFFSTASAQLKKRVAVFTFEDKSDHSWGWWNGKSPGEGMADMLTTTLVKSGKYTVIERQEIARILEEQRLGQTGAVTPQSAAAIGKLLGVELAIMGAVTEFGYTREGKGVRIKGIGVGGSKQEATVAIDVRFVNTSTGEIIAAETVRKKKSKSGISVSTPKFGFKSRSQFDNSLVGKATREAINKIVKLIDEQIGALPWEGKIILVSGNTIYIKPGSDAGVKVGDLFYVYTKGEELIDPDTGLSLGSEEKKIGSIMVTGIISGGKAAKAVVKMGGGFKKGDIIRIN